MAPTNKSVLVSLSAALLGVLSGAATTGLLIADAAARVAQPFVRRRNEELQREDPLLVIAPQHSSQVLLAGHSSHRSHSSHSSHYSGSRSHASHYSGSGSYGGGGTSEPQPKPARVRPPKPARVSFVAFPGGQIFVDGKAAGQDATSTMKVVPGAHSIRIVNRYLGEATVSVEVSEGQTGIVEVRWEVSK